MPEMPQVTLPTAQQNHTENQGLASAKPRLPAVLAVMVSPNIASGQDVVLRDLQGHSTLGVPLSQMPF
jgi:hypothetical protein